MSKKDSTYRETLRSLKQGQKKLLEEYGPYIDKIRDGAQSIDEEIGFSETAKETLKKTKAVAQEIGIPEAAGAIGDTLQSGFTAGKKGAKAIDDELALSSTLRDAGQSLNSSLVRPSQDYLEKVGIVSAISEVGQRAEALYGDVRFAAKPYLEPEDLTELLLDTRSELIYITACVLQVSTKKAENWLGEFGKLLTAKLAGVLGTTTLFGLVGAFGTAGTGTAIAGLSGAAATNATLAWVGGLLGGGMATGVILTAGVGLVVGVGAYKLFDSEARSIEDLHETDRGVVETAGLLVAAIDELLAQDPIQLSGAEAQLFLQNTLVPYHKALVDEAEDMCSRLDKKNAFAYRQHVLKDFEPTVIAGFSHFVEQSDFGIESLIGGVIYALLTRTALDGSAEQDAVLAALRRSNNELSDLSESQISDYLAQQSPEQLQGIANNTKGIYHEIRWVEDYNASHNDSFARFMEATNHPGVDVEIVDAASGEVLKQWQHKATDSSGKISEHFERHSEIDVLATDEVASQLPGVDSSGFSNRELSADVDAVIGAMATNTVEDRVQESVGLVGLATAGREAIEVLQGRSNLDHSARRLTGNIIQAAGATGITAYLFG